MPRITSFLPWTLLCLLSFATLKSPLFAQPERTYELLDQVVKKKDKNLLYEVRQNIQLANGKRAIEGLNTLLTTYPNNVDLAYMRGAIHQEMKQYSAAAADFERGVQLAPDYKVGAIYDLGKLYQRTGEFGRAQQ
jgi:tetratricopeptide (TPR) repeat protein